MAKYHMTEVTSIIKKLKELIPSNANHENSVIVCVGTDRSTGDSLGPYVGTLLKKAGFQNVVGDLYDPCHAENLSEKLLDIHPNKTVIAIDACLGQVSSVGCIGLDSGPLNPGAALGKELPPVGDFHMFGVVNVGGFMEYFVLQNTRLSLVVSMAETIASALMSVFPSPGISQVAAAIEIEEASKTA